MTAARWNDLVAGIAGLPAFAALWATAQTLIAQRFPRLRFLFGSLTGSWGGDVLLYCRFGFVSVAVALAQHEFMFAAGCAASTAVAWLIRFWRRRRDRVRALLGAKSRALRDALAARMPKPRPVLVPQRGAP